MGMGTRWVWVWAVFCARGHGYGCGFVPMSNMGMGMGLLCPPYTLPIAILIPKLGDDMFNGDDIFSLPSFDEQIYYDDSMPPFYDYYGEGVSERS